MLRGDCDQVQNLSVSAWTLGSSAVDVVVKGRIHKVDPIVICNQCKFYLYLEQLENILSWTSAITSINWGPFIKMVMSLLAVTSKS